MVSGGLNTEPIAPTVIFVPVYEGEGVNCSTGMLKISGAKLFLASGANWYKVTSADDA